MNLKAVRKAFYGMMDRDPNDAAVCTLCGLGRKEVEHIVEAKHGYVCLACANDAAAAVSGKAHELFLAKCAIDWLLRLLDSTDARTPHPSVEQVLQAALALTESNGSGCRESSSGIRGADVSCVASGVPSKTFAIGRVARTEGA